jgi:Ca2+-binding EF-hand superfamily protein
MLRTLDRDKDGSLGPNEATALQLAVLDQDRDGIISSAEIDHSTAVLRSLDSNHDGTVVLAEVLAAVRAAKVH